MDRSADGCMSAMQPIHGSSHLQPTSSPSSPAVALSRLLQLIAALIQHHSTSMRIPTKNLFFCPSVPTRHDQSLTKCSQFHLPFCERRTLGDVAIMVRGVVVWAVKRLHDLSLRSLVGSLLDHPLNQSSFCIRSGQSDSLSNRTRFKLRKQHHFSSSHLLQ